jgi:CRAL/TRIO domain
MALFKSILHIDQHYYPERLHQAFFINSPWLFQGLWAIISPLLDPVTKTKVRAREGFAHFDLYVVNNVYA